VVGIEFHPEIRTVKPRSTGSLFALGVVAQTIELRVERTTPGGHRFPAKHAPGGTRKPRDPFGAGRNRLQSRFVSLNLIAIARPPDFQCRRWNGVSLLDYMRKLVSQEKPALPRFGHVFAFSKCDLRADGVRPRSETGCGPRRGLAGVYAHASEVMPQPLFEKPARLRIQPSSRRIQNTRQTRVAALQPNPSDALAYRHTTLLHHITAPQSHRDPRKCPTTEGPSHPAL